jgi:magnesium-transporting ATPase (P-type)
LIKTDLKDRLTNRDGKKIIYGVIIGTFIAITPYIYYSYESIPDTQVWNTFLFTYDSKYYESALMAGWTFMGKFIPLLLLFIWFFTNRHWWYHALLVPISMYVFQLIDVLNDDVSFFDEYQLMYLVPIMAIIIPSIYLIRAQMFNKINDADKTLEELEEEFMIKPKSFIKKLGDYF